MRIQLVRRHASTATTCLYQPTSGLLNILDFNKERNVVSDFSHSLSSLYFTPLLSKYVIDQTLLCKSLVIRLSILSTHIKIKRILV